MERKLLLLTLGILTGLLWGCAAAPKPYVHVCPALARYSAAQQQEAAREMRDLPQNWMVLRMIRDYGALRQQVRDCHDA